MLAGKTLAAVDSAINWQQIGVKERDKLTLALHNYANVLIAVYYGHLCDLY